MKKRRTCLRVNLCCVYSIIPKEQIPKKVKKIKRCQSIKLTLSSLNHITKRAAVPLVPEGQTLDTIGTVSFPVCDIDSSVRGRLDHLKAAFLHDL